MRKAKAAFQIGVFLFFVIEAVGRKVEISTSIGKLGEISLHDEYEDTEWESDISILFNQQKKVTELTLNSIVLSEYGLNKLLMEDLSALKSLNITSVVLTQSLMKILLGNKMIYEQL